jgi:hypothetical protein
MSCLLARVINDARVGNDARSALINKARAELSLRTSIQDNGADGTKNDQTNTRPTATGVEPRAAAAGAS